MSNDLDPDQDRHSVGPDLGTNCLQILKLSADDKVAASKDMLTGVSHIGICLPVGSCLLHSKQNAK